jgi:hypothetical protein
MLSRDAMEAAILAGGSVLVDQQIVTRVQDLPTQAELDAIAQHAATGLAAGRRVSPRYPGRFESPAPPLGA